MSCSRPTLRPRRRSRWWICTIRRFCRRQSWRETRLRPPTRWAMWTSLPCSPAIPQFIPMNSTINRQRADYEIAIARIHGLTGDGPRRPERAGRGGGTLMKNHIRTIIRWTALVVAVALIAIPAYGQARRFAAACLSWQSHAKLKPTHAATTGVLRAAEAHSLLV